MKKVYELEIEQVGYSSDDCTAIVITADDEVKIPAVNGNKEISVVVELVEILARKDLDIVWIELTMDKSDYGTNLRTTGKCKATDLFQFVEECQYWYYYSGYGSQELFGTVMLSDGTWLTRSVYDGSEEWEHHKAPETPKWVKLTQSN